MRRVTVAVVLALFLVAIASSAAYARPNEYYTIAYHTVRPGETLSSIARMYGVSAMAIASHNGICNPNYIYSWQVLAIPNAYGTSYWCGYQQPTYYHRPSYNTWYQPTYHYGWGCRYYHTVSGGENLYRISLQYGVSMWRIAQANNLGNINYVQLGSTLCIP